MSNLAYSFCGLNCFFFFLIHGLNGFWDVLKIAFENLNLDLDLDSKLIYLKFHDFKSTKFRYHNFKFKDSIGLKFLVDLPNSDLEPFLKHPNVVFRFSSPEFKSMCQNLAIQTHQKGISNIGLGPWMMGIFGTRMENDIVNI